MSEKYWRIHIDRVLKREIKSLLALTLDLLSDSKPKRRRGLGFVASYEGNGSSELEKILIDELTDFVYGKTTKKDQVMDDFNEIAEIDRMISELKEFTKDMSTYHVDLKKQKLQRIMAPKTEREKELFNLGLILIESAFYGDAGVAKKYIDEGFPINFQHPISKKNILHIAAMRSAERLVDVLVDSKKCDYLLRDNQGSLAVDLSYYHGTSFEIHETLKQKTEEQIKKQGLDLVLSYEAP